MTTRTSKKEWPLTVAPELLASWQKLRRKKDPETIAAKLGVSRPVIDRALIYGYVGVENLATGITLFFEERLNQERKDAARLNNLAETV